jgi:hypothetical protein
MQYMPGAKGAICALTKAIDMQNENEHSRQKCNMSIYVVQERRQNVGAKGPSLSPFIHAMSFRIPSVIHIVSDNLRASSQGRRGCETYCSRRVVAHTALAGMKGIETELTR